MSLVTSSRWKSLFGPVLDALLPPLCLSCDAAVGGDQTLCPACWGQIHFIAAPFCSCCGAPFDIPVGDNMLCGQCIAEPPHYAAARAAMLYNDHSKNLTLSFKYGDRIHAAKSLAAWMYRAGQEFWGDADILMPVPLHRWRLLKRRYNQAALLAQNIARLAQKPVLVDGLERTRPTPTQGHLSRKERLTNIKGAFRVKSCYLPRIENKTIVLVDDVLTTGATVNECSHVLLQAGAKAVNILTIARTRSVV